MRWTSPRRFEVYGNKCSLFAGYRILGPAPLVDPTTNVPDFTGAGPRSPPPTRSAIELQDDGVGMNQLGAFGTFDVVTGLAVRLVPGQRGLRPGLLGDHRRALWHRLGGCPSSIY
jgi:hypothetical protein